MSGGSVCLRCRLHLLLQYNRPLQIPNRLLGIREPGLRCLSSESIARSFDGDPASEERDNIPDGHKHATGTTPPGSKIYERRKTDSSKRHLSRNRILTEGAESLDSDMLGKPASVIIMRDGGPYQKKNRTISPDNPGNEPTSHGKTDIEALLHKQREPLIAQEVRENIDSLRPKTETTLSEREFRKLQSLLTDGFLSAQLAEYLERHKQHRLTHESLQLNAGTVEEQEQAPQYNWIIDISPWIPRLRDQSSIKNVTNPSLYGYVTDSATVKEKLAVRVMRECWGLSIAEVDAGLGETTIKVQRQPFHHLTRGTQRWKTVLGNILLDPGESFEASHKQKTLRLVTTRTKASTLLKELDETLKQIANKSFSVDHVASGPVDEAVLEEVGRVTNTNVRESQFNKTFDVTWIEPRERTSESSAGLEDQCDLVFRLLLTALNPQPATTTTLCAVGVDKRTTGRFVTDTTSRVNLGWKDRMGQWARYILPLAAEGSSSAADSPMKRLELPVEPQITLPKSVETRDILRDTQIVAQPIKWADELRTSTRADFGYLLHANDLSISPPPLPDLLATHHPRVLAPVVPHPLHLAKFETSNNQTNRTLIQTKITVVIRFWPSPNPNPSSRPKKKSNGNEKKPECRAAQAKYCNPEAPILELRLAASGGQIRGVENLRAIRQTHITDVMLPASPVDIRLAQTQYAVLEGEPASLATWQPLAEFLGPARLDLAHGELETPPRQSFPIPRRLFNSSPASAATTGQDPDDVVSTLYTLVGMEVCRSVSIPYGGCKLTYTSVNAGRGGGRRAEVSLEPALGNEASSEESNTGNLHDDFLTTCQRFAGTDTLWSGYPADREGS